MPATLLDSSTFSAGRIDAYAMQVSLAPSTTGSTTRGTPPIDVTGANWIRVRVYDVDGDQPRRHLCARLRGVRRERTDPSAMASHRPEMAAAHRARHGTLRSALLDVALRWRL